MLEVKNVKKTFSKGKRKVRAVDDISFTVKKGEVLSILGPNGAGKTTMLKMIATILTPDSGTIHLDGSEVRKDSLKVRSKIAYMQQEPELNPYFSVEEQIRYYLLFQRMGMDLSKKKCEFALRNFGLEKHRHKKPIQLSTGLKRRVQIASVLSTAAPITFLDEPTTGLDPKSKRDTWDYIKKNLIDKKDSSIILTTHDLREAERLSDRVIIINEGKVIERGTPRTLDKKFSKVLQIIFEKPLSLKPAIKKELLNFEEVEEVSEIWDDTIQIRVDNINHTIGGILRVFEKNDICIEDISTQAYEFEDVYLDIIERETGKGDDPSQVLGGIGL